MEEVAHDSQVVDDLHQVFIAVVDSEGDILRNKVGHERHEEGVDGWQELIDHGSPCLSHDFEFNCDRAVSPFGITPVHIFLYDFYFSVYYPVGIGFLIHNNLSDFQGLVSDD